MADCDICKILDNKKSFKFVYEDKHCFAILHESPMIPGHTLVIPKKHSPIIEELDDDIVKHIFNVANNISTSLFESLGVSGTNIILNNGTDAGQDLPHVVINVIPRKEADNINLEWTASKASDEQLKTVESMIKLYANNIFAGKDILPSAKVVDKQETDDDYMIEHLKRIP